MTITGRCGCGAIRYAAEGGPPRAPIRAAERPAWMETAHALPAFARFPE